MCGGSAFEILHGGGGLTYVCEMNYRICFLVAVLCPVTLIEAGSPLTAYYDSKDEKYVLTKPQETSLASDLLLEDDLKRPKVIHCCPAETDEQKKIQEEIGKNVEIRFQALFVKQRTDPNDANENVVCTYEYEPSARTADGPIYSPKIIIGYAIHKSINNKINWPEKNEYSVLGAFIWVFEKQITYSFMTRGAVRSVHYIFPNQHTDTGTCPNYDLASNIIGYNTKDIKRFYDRTNQNIAFKDFDRPGTGEYYDEDVVITTSTSGILREHESGTKKVPREVLQEVVLHQLIPIEDFQEEHSKRETCSSANTIPIWSSIHNGSLKNVEQYIRRIADKLPTNNSLTNRLKVRTMVRELLWNENSKIVDLNREEILYPVYRQLVKLISYSYSPLESSQQKEPQQESHQIQPKKLNKRHLYIGIVIHNELGPPETTLCRFNACSQLGWHVTSMEGGLTYCCLLNEFPLPYSDLFKSENIPHNYEPFDLNKILPEGVNPAPPLVKVAGTNPAVIVLYYPQEDTYKYADFKELQKLNLQSNDESQFTNILLYCPPETTDEKVSASLLNVDVMFVRQIVPLASDIRDLNICANQYKPAIWKNPKINSGHYYGYYHVGYLVSEHEMKWRSEYRDVVLFLIKYNILYVSAMYSEHVLMSRKQTTASSDLCEDNMQLGLEHLKNVNESTFVNAYNREYQINNLNYEYDSSKYYFVKKQLIPIGDFDDDGRKLATCSYMNTYPVWNYVHSALLVFENYLRTILMGSKTIDKFYIRTQLISVLKLPARKTTPKENDTDNTSNSDPKVVYLDAGKTENIMVPARIMKIIGHRVPLPRKEGEDSNTIEYKYYFMTIMFENSMNNTVDEKCRVVECIDYGWDVKGYEWSGNHPYCCEPDVIALYNFELPFTAEEGQYEMLNLKNVVTKLDENGVPAGHDDIAKSVNQG